MKWFKVAILLLQPEDAVCRNSADLWKRRYGIPFFRCFALGQAAGYFNALAGSLTHAVDLETKLIIVSHGSVCRVGDYNASEFLKLLDQLGVHRVGLLAFRGCNLGKERFLDDLQIFSRLYGIQIGWMLAYRGIAGTADYHAGAHEIITVTDKLLRFVSNGNWKAPDSQRVRVLKGNVHVLPSAGSSRRYH